MVKGGMVYLDRSSSLGEKHDSKSGADGSGRQVGGKSSQHCTIVAVTPRNSAPDGLLYLNHTLNLFSALPECPL